MNKSVKKLTKPIIAIIIIAVVVVLLKDSFVEKPLLVEVVEIKTKQIIDSFIEDGIVKQGSSFNIVSEVSGKVIEVYVDKNTYVEEGTILAKIDTKDYEYEKLMCQNNISSHEAKISEAINNEKNDKQNFYFNIEQLNEDLKKLESQKKSSEINKTQKEAEIDKIVSSTPDEKIRVLELAVEVAKNDVNYSKRNYDAINSLFEVGAVSKEQTDEAKNTLTKSEKELIKAETDLDLNKKELERLKNYGVSDTELNSLFYKQQNVSVEASMNSVKSQINSIQNKINTSYSSDTVKYLNSLIENENVALKQLDDKINNCIIKSKVSGYVVDLPAKNQSTVQLGTIIATLKTKENFIIESDILTNSVPYLKVGDEVKIFQRLKSEDITYKGNIKEIYNFAKEATSVLGLEEHRVTVVVEVLDENVNLKDGYEVELEFQTYKEDNQLSVPNSSIFKIDGEEFIFKIKDNKTVLNKITTKHKTNSETVIAEGLDSGDNIVYNANIEGLKEGIIVSYNRN